MAKPDDDLGKTKKLMGALVHMKPKPHEEMKLGKPRSARPAKAKKKRSAEKKS
jgi:hypothetical protein